MNSYSNSDSKQSPESKLGWVHRMHTQGPGGVHTVPRPCAQRVLSIVSRSCHYARTAVSSPLPVMINKLYRNPSLCRSSCRASCTTCRSLLDRVARFPVVSWRMPSCVAALYHNPKFPPSATIHFFLYRNPLMARPCARCHTPRAYAGCVISRVVA